jgi:hypothetical protein
MSCINLIELSFDPFASKLFSEYVHSVGHVTTTSKLVSSSRNEIKAAHILLS